MDAIVNGLMQLWTSTGIFGFLFPDQQYTPTEDLVFISDNIAYITGIYPEVTEESTEETDGY